jgi:hypothetical protein
LQLNTTAAYSLFAFPGRDSISRLLSVSKKEAGVWEFEHALKELNAWSSRSGSKHYEFMFSESKRKMMGGYERARFPNVCEYDEPYVAFGSRAYH